VEGKGRRLKEKKEGKKAGVFNAFPVRVKETM